MREDASPSAPACDTRRGQLMSIVTAATCLRAVRRRRRTERKATTSRARYPPARHKPGTHVPSHDDDDVHPETRFRVTFRRDHFPHGREWCTYVYKLGNEIKKKKKKKSETVLRMTGKRTDCYAINWIFPSGTGFH